MKSLIPVALATAFSTSTASAAVAALGVNLVHNGDFEADAGEVDFTPGLVSGWNDMGAVYGDTSVTTDIANDGRGNVQLYSSGSSQTGSQSYSDAPPSDPSAPLHQSPPFSTYYGTVAENGQEIKGSGNLLGANYLYAAGGASYTLSQTINLSGATDLLTVIDSGLATYTAEGWFGGYQTGDWSSFIISFHSSTDGSGTALGSATIGQNGRNYTNEMYFHEGSGLVPIGTQSITFTANLARTTGGGTPNDAAIDNLAFVIIPEPSAALLGSIGLLALLRRRR